ncbi:unnamed protein product [Ranitomeya imitator]|uniref:Uncharacterized protein n=1 Tax=Ranitomeya imitator TaxID=111125 RepID=A0ABN9LM08_9NEOB|nr:unnamed protein product [Ranitomeya imitator]
MKKKMNKVKKKLMSKMLMMMKMKVWEKLNNTLRSGTGQAKMGDVKTRWRSVTDRYLKSLKTPSGSSPPRKRVPYGDQLQFILGSRSLRRTESNVSAQTPPDLNDGDTTVDSIGEEVEDSIMNSQESPGNMSLSGRSPEITDSLGEHDVAANTTTSTSSDAGANSGGGVSRHMGRGAASVRPVALKRTVQKKTKQGQIIEQLTTKTLNLLDNSSKQDEHDKFGSLLADRVRTLPRDKQQMFVTAVNCLFMAIDDTPTLPPAPQVMTGNIRGLSTALQNALQNAVDKPLMPTLCVRRLNSLHPEEMLNQIVQLVLTLGSGDSQILWPQQL